MNDMFFLLLNEFIVYLWVCLIDMCNMWNFIECVFYNSVYYFNIKVYLYGNLMLNIYYCIMNDM